MTPVRKSPLSLRSLLLQLGASACPTARERSSKPEGTPTRMGCGAGVTTVGCQTSFTLTHSWEVRVGTIIPVHCVGDKVT